MFKFVYSSFTSLITTAFLLLSFLLQGANFAYANTSDEEKPNLVAVPAVGSQEKVEEETSIPVIESQEAAVEVVVDEETPPTLVVDESMDETQNEVATLSPELSIKEEDFLSKSEASATGTEEVTVVTISDNSSTSTPNNVDGTLINDVTYSASGDETVSGETEPENLTSTTTVTDLLVRETDTATSATSTLVLDQGATYAVVNSDDEFRFHKSQCTKLATGSYYCLEQQQEVLEDALFAAPDADGDLEIFLVRNGSQSQVTFNKVDDNAPFYDPNSNSLVWQRLMDERYQIISYDIKTGEERQLTNGAVNNMEPNRQGKYIVWQSWVTNNWDIVLFDGEKETILTHSSEHDIAPYIHGSLVVWNKVTNNGQKLIEMYNIDTETYVTIDDPDGLSVSNPRMVFVYDSLYPNGDIVTKGYDVIAKKFINIDTLPKQLPESIPNSEPTNETRALIQPKPVLKSDEIKQTTTTALDPVAPLPASEDSFGTTTIDMKNDLGLLELSSTTVSSSDFLELTEYDLVILNDDIEESSTSSSQTE